MTASKSGDVVLVPFPFADLQTTKRRPALVLVRIPSRSMSPLAVVAMITSQLEGETLLGDCCVGEWKEAGLFHPSKVRLAKLVTIEENLFQKKLGALQKKDLAVIGRELTKVFSEWI